MVNVYETDKRKTPHTVYETADSNNVYVYVDASFKKGRGGSSLRVVDATRNVILYEDGRSFDVSNSSKAESKTLEWAIEMTEDRLSSKINPVFLPDSQYALLRAKKKFPDKQIILNKIAKRKDPHFSMKHYNHVHRGARKEIGLGS